MYIYTVQCGLLKVHHELDKEKRIKKRRENVGYSGLLQSSFSLNVGQRGLVSDIQNPST